MVGDAVEQSASEPFRPEDLSPFLEGQVAGYQRRCTFISLTEGLEQQFGAAFGQGHVSQFVDDEKLIAGQLFLEAQQVLVIASFDQLTYQRGSGSESHAMTTLTGR